jgi:hypothetical protein
VPSPRRHQIDLGVTLGSTVLLLFLAQLRVSSVGWSAALMFVAGLLLLAQPYALLRLIEHFRPLPRGTRWTVVGCAALGILALIALPYPRPAALPVTLAAYFGTVQGCAAWAFASESRRRAGVTRRRLWLAGAGASIAMALVVLEGVGWIFGARLALPLQLLVWLGMVTGYALGLAPPRRLLRSWQRTEFVRFLVRTTERPPDERADVLADELNGAATRSVTAVTTAVLLGRDELATHASSDPTWEGLRVSPDAGLVGVALGGAEPVVGAREEAEPPLNDLADGDVVAIIPIVRSSPHWGVLVFVQRRASLYLPDDLSQLGTLCRHAADILDHARLAHRERDRQQPQAETPVLQD